jgi:hypothetical protein
MASVPDLESLDRVRFDTMRHMLRERSDSIKRVEVCLESDNPPALHALRAQVKLLVQVGLSFCNASLAQSGNTQRTSQSIGLQSFSLRSMPS